jgi:hypothetical protein
MAITYGLPASRTPASAPERGSAEGQPELGTVERGADRELGAHPAASPAANPQAT